MPVYSREDVPLEFELEGVGATRAIDEGGLTIAFERLRAGVDTTPIYRGLPGDACQSRHWGYVVSGRLRIIRADGTEETVAAGQAYYMPPGHNVVIEEDAEVVEFSPAAERARTMEHAAQVMAEA
jgi:hypothetical protein